MTKISSLSNEEKDKKLKWYEDKYGPYIEKRGLHNWKNLFKKPTGSELIQIVILLLVLFLAYAYIRDTAICRDLVQRDIQEHNITINPSPLPNNFSIQNSSMNSSNGGNNPI